MWGKPLAVLVVLLGLLPLGIALWWRHRSLPCPGWLFPLLDNHLTAVGGRHLPCLERLDLCPGMRVLDVGCGPGRISIPVARAVGPDGLVVGLDMQPSVLKRLNDRARARGLRNIATVCGRIGRGLVQQNTFDRALLVMVLGEIPEAERQPALREIHAALKRDGVLSVTELFGDPHYQRRDTVRRVAEAAGFRLEREYGTWLAFTLNFVKAPTC